MNTAHFWSKDEDAAILSGIPFEEFAQRYPDITWNAYRFRKARLLSDQVAAVEKSVPAVTGSQADFVGFNIGYFDIETTFSNQPRVLYAAVADQFGNVEQFSRDMYPGTNRLMDDKELVEAYVNRLRQFDILVSWNGKLFDVPVLNGRLAYHNSDIRRLDPNMHIDLMYYATGQFMRIGRKSLQSVSTYFGTQNGKTPLLVETWDRAVTGDDAAYKEIADHCDADVLVLREVFANLKYQIRNVHR